MPAANEAISESPTPEDFLRLALEASSASRRARFARDGLDGGELTPDTQMLLLRQLYLAHLDLHQLEEASAVARSMVASGSLPDVAHSDSARVLFALGDLDGAIREQRLAARTAPPERRSFHLWSLATVQHHGDRTEDALRSLKRAQLWSTKDSPLLRAHAAYIRLDSGEPPERLRESIDALSRSGCREGYGQFLLGMIAYLMGDRPGAAAQLRAFLRRNAALDAAKALTLREELRRARVALADLESE